VRHLAVRRAGPLRVDRRDAAWTRAVRLSPPARVPV